MSSYRRTATPVTNSIEMVAAEHVEIHKPGKKCVTYHFPGEMRFETQYESSHERDTLITQMLPILYEFLPAICYFSNNNNYFAGT